MTEGDIINITEGWHRRVTEEFRTKKVLSLFGFIVMGSTNFDKGDYHKTGKWFKMVEVKQRKVFDRTQKFDDGWSYSYYWGEWKPSWKLEEIIG
jgi:hypothetical protein